MRPPASIPALAGKTGGRPRGRISTGITDSGECDPMTGDIDSVNHIGLAVRDLDAASSLYETMGFSLSPLSVHQGSSKPGAPVEPMATGNRCAVFGVNYIELLGIVNPGKMDWGWGRFVDRFEGAHIICYGCGDAAVVNDRVAGNGIGTSGVIRLQRDIDVEGQGMRTARFDCVHFDGEATPEGLIQAAYHHNPEYVHQPRYQGHANGATDLAEVTLCMMDAEAAARRYEKLTGQAAKADGEGWIIDLPRATRLRFLALDGIDVAHHQPQPRRGAGRRYGAEAVAPVAAAAKTL